MTTEVLKGLAQRVARVLRPIRPNSIHHRIVLKQVSHKGSIVAPDRVTGQAAGLCQPGFGEPPIRQPRHILFTQARRLSRARLNVGFEATLFGRNEEPLQDGL